MTEKTTQDKEAEAKAAADLKAKQDAAASAQAKGVAPAEATKPAENVKVSVPAGSVPTSMQASGPTPPHPSEDRADQSSDTPEIAAARVRAAGDDDEPAKVANKGDPVGDPIQCIVKKRFFDERQALIREGKTYFYQRRKDEVFPYDVLEPVSKSVAAAVRKEHAEAKARKEETARERQRRREAFARMAAETE